MNKKNVLFIFLLVMLLIIPIVVNGETLTGTIDTSGVNTTLYYPTGTIGMLGAAQNLSGIGIKTIQNMGKPSAVIVWSTTSTGETYNPLAFGVTNPYSGEATPVTFYLSDTTTIPHSEGSFSRGTGTVGYQRIFNGAGAEIQGYIYIVFDSNFNTTGLTGDVYFNITYPHSLYADLHGVKFTYTMLGGLGDGGIPAGMPTVWGSSSGMNGRYTFNRDVSFLHTYTVTKYAAGTIPLISGSILKNNYYSKVFITNSNYAIQTSEYTYNNTNWNFTSNSEQIYISVVDLLSNWHNTTLLFSPALPTPTPTPTATYPPNVQYYNATFVIKNANNLTAIPNVYVDFEINANEGRQGYTNSSGMITFNEIKTGANQVLRITKVGYQYNTFLYPNPVYGDVIRTEYMYPDIGGNPLTPSAINVTIQVKSSNGNSPIDQAYVTIKDVIAGTPEQGAYTNASGYVTFQHFPNTAYIEGIISKSGYTSYNWHPDIAGMQMGDITVLRYLTPIASPTPTLPAYDTWTLTASPASILLGSSTTLTAACSNATKQSYPTLRTVLYYDNNNLGAYSSPVLIGTYNYNTSTSKWNFKDKNGTWNYSYASYNPISLSDIPTIAGTHTYSVYTFGAGNYPYTTSTDLGNALTNVVVSGSSTGGGSTLTMNLFAIDGATTSHLQDYGLVLTNTITGQSNIYNVSYDVNVNLPRGALMRLEGDKEGYNHGSVDFTVPTDINIVAGTFGAMKGVNLFPYGSYIASNVTVTVHVDDAETYYPLSNVAVYMTGSLAPKYTGTQGESVSFIMPENYPFTVRAVKDGYCSVSDAKNTSQASNGYLYVPLFMKFGNCAGGITPTHTPIGNITPTITPTLPYGNQGNATAGTCSSLNWTSNASWFDKMRGLLACNNVPDLLTQNLIIACGLIIVIAAIGAKYAKGIGFAVGSILGAVIAMGLGLIPFWMIAVLIVACIAIILSKTILTSGG